MIFTMKFEICRIQNYSPRNKLWPQDARHGASAGSGGVRPLAQPHYTAIDTETVLKLTTIKSDAHDVCHLPYLNSNS